MSNVVYILLQIFTFLVTNEEALARIAQRRAATWNLQGSSAGTERKWTDIKLFMDTNEVAILALQEAGTPSSSARLQGDLGDRLIHPYFLHQEVQEYIWNLGNSSRPDNRYIYYIEDDLREERRNLAIVTKQKPDYVLILRAPGDYRGGRSILGVLFNKDAYFTIHASTMGGGDAPSIVNHIAHYFTSDQYYYYQFMIMGDFNKNPRDLKSSLHRNHRHRHMLRYMDIYSTNTPTDRQGCILDYAVIGQYSYELPRHIVVHSFQPNLTGQLVSDHTPVVFNVVQN